MARVRRLTAAALVLVAALGTAGSAKADGFGWFGCRDCPRPDYSPLNYWAPRAVKASDCIHGPFLPLHAPEIHPDIAPTTYILQYPCPPVLPADTLIPVPTPPATSKFRY